MKPSLCDYCEEMAVYSGWVEIDGYDKWMRLCKLHQENEDVVREIIQNHEKAYVSEAGDRAWKMSKGE